MGPIEAWFMASVAPIVLSFLAVVVPALSFWIVRKLSAAGATAVENGQKLDRIAQVADYHTDVLNGGAHGPPPPTAFAVPIITTPGTKGTTT